jgi:hypothetical protein
MIGKILNFDGVSTHSNKTLESVSFFMLPNSIILRAA